MIDKIRKILGNDKKGNAPIKEEPLTIPVPRNPETVVEEEVDFYPIQLQVGTGQSVGRQREHNEDALFFINSLISDEKGQTAVGLFIVADGMGGHQHGEVASETAARVVQDYVMRTLFAKVMSVEPELQSESLQEIMEQAVNAAQEIVVKKAPGGGTTLTAALIMGEQVTLAHVGDSRAYFIHEDQIQLLTQDHTLVHRLVELGQLSEEQAKVYPQRNVVYRAIGQLEPFTPDIHTHMFPRHGYLLVCSDGLWGCVADEEMKRIVKQNPDPSMACHRLVDAANLAGGPDNISAILVKHL